MLGQRAIVRALGAAALRLLALALMWGAVGSGPSVAQAAVQACGEACPCEAGAAEAQQHAEPHAQGEAPCDDSCPDQCPDCGCCTGLWWAPPHAPPNATAVVADLELYRDGSTHCTPGSSPGVFRPPRTLA